jgi:hypothetical protein
MQAKLSQSPASHAFQAALGFASPMVHADESSELSIQDFGNICDQLRVVDSKNREIFELSTILVEQEYGLAGILVLFRPAQRACLYGVERQAFISVVEIQALAHFFERFAWATPWLKNLQNCTASYPLGSRVQGVSDEGASDVPDDVDGLRS